VKRRGWRCQPAARSVDGDAFFRAAPHTMMPASWYRLRQRPHPDSDVMRASFTAVALYLVHLVALPHVVVGQRAANARAISRGEGQACERGFVKRVTRCISLKQATDAEIRQYLISESIAAYPGTCPCPYFADRAGRSCGRRSAYSRPGGYSPLCYESDVTAVQIREARLKFSS
jgi:hypothetical protein